METGEAEVAGACSDIYPIHAESCVNAGCRLHCYSSRISSNPSANQTFNAQVVNINIQSAISGPKRAPQIVLLLDNDVQVLSVNRGLAGKKFDSISATEQQTLHSQLHPDCDGKCRFNEMWSKAWESLNNRGSVEWEVDDPQLKRLLRLNLSAQPAAPSASPDRRQQHKILTITDITKYRREYELLVEEQQALVRLLMSEDDSPIDIAENRFDEAGDTGNRLMASLVKEDRSFGRQLILAQENERKRVASELHDGISQTIGVVKYNIEASAASLAKQYPDLDLSALDGAISDIRGLIEEIRRISNNLSPSVLEDFGVQVALEILCKEFTDQNENVTVNCKTCIDEGETPDLVKIAIYRITQEALNNVAKHASATQVDITLSSTNERVLLRVADNGVGVNLPEVDRASTGQTGFGLRNMRERATATGGSFTVRSAPEAGLEIRVEWTDEAEVVSLP